MTVNSSAERFIPSQSQTHETSQPSLTTTQPPAASLSTPPVLYPTPSRPRPTYTGVSLTRPRLSIITHLSQFRPRSQTLEPSRLPSYDAVLLGSNIRVLGRAASPLSMAGAYPASINPPDVTPTTPTGSVSNTDWTSNTYFRHMRLKSGQRNLTRSTSMR
jgi:hypothetical protein